MRVPLSYSDGVLLQNIRAVLVSKYDHSFVTDLLRTRHSLTPAFKQESPMRDYKYSQEISQMV